MEFNIVDKLLGMTLLGAEWVLWLLLALSVWSVAIIFERIFYFFFQINLDFKAFNERLNEYLAAGNIKEAEELCAKLPAIEARIALQGLKDIDKGSKVAERNMYNQIALEKPKVDRGLTVLGTLGNNAPFIGLFGTVIGIIKAFNDLAINPDGGPEVVMAGISEALVATAVGLMVAIPAVVAFNYFLKIGKTHINNADTIAKLILNHAEK